MRQIRYVVGLVLALGLVTGCGPTFTDLPLPGSRVSGDTVELQMKFDEALSLAQGAMIKVNGIESGRVESVTVKDYKALVKARVQRSSKIRQDASARLRYTTPLGELFVDVTNPEEGALLADGGMIDPDRSTTAPTVEDTLSQASLLINGGGIGNLAVINKELNLALGGHEEQARHLNQQGAKLLTQANATTEDISRTLDALNSVSQILDQRKDTIHAALRDVQPAAAVLRENTPGLTRLLGQLKRFAAMSNEVVGATGAAIRQQLRMIGPILDEFLANANKIGPTLRSLVDLGQKVEKTIPADYVNIFLHLKLGDIPADDPSRDQARSANTAATTGVPVEVEGNLEEMLNALNSGSTKGSTSRLTMSGMTMRGGQ
ncbi:MAG TPA: MCE family protein [Marmoricola sp.]|nr:MCE family protein [Marmoricola sp.]HMY08153.1 MCE family protein [Marmoricola sp.]HRV70042.1 MCE family protein [Marmoricola sp.]